MGRREGEGWRESKGSWRKGMRLGGRKGIGLDRVCGEWNGGIWGEGEGNRE